MKDWSKATMLLLDRPFSEAQLAASTQADLRNIGAKVWPTVLSLCQATDLRLYHLTLHTLDGIEKLPGPRRLELEWSTKISDLAPVFKLRRLASLSIFDFPKLRHLDGIEALTELDELHLSGSRGALTPVLQLASLEPVAQLRALRSFSLSNARLDDDDLTPLARCTGLRELRVSAKFERAQIAFLAKRFNPQLAQPLVPHLELGIGCESCGAPRHLFVGRRMPALCRHCDGARFDKLVAEFERLVRDA